MLCDGGVVHAHHLPPTLQTAESSGTRPTSHSRKWWKRWRRTRCRTRSKQARGNRAVAARLLRTTRRIFNYKVRNYGIDWHRFQ